MTERLVLRVTEEQIREPQDQTNRCGTCPVARAAQKATGVKAAAEPWSVYVYHGSRYHGVWRTSRSAYRFIRAFDAGKTVKPSTFVLTRETAR